MVLTQITSLLNHLKPLLGYVMVICYVMLYVKADPYILGVWPVTVICVKWASIGRSSAIA